MKNVLPATRTLRSDISRAKAFCSPLTLRAFARRAEASKTVLAIGVPAEEAHGSIRFTFGRENTMDDVKYTVDELEKTVKRLRSMSPLFAESTAKITMI